jgi:nucleoside-diphosphate-sugar epimerase
MSILVTGATGTLGSLIVQRLADAGADVKALVLAALYVTHQTDFAGGLTASSFRFGAVTIEPAG